MMSPSPASSRLQLLCAALALALLLSLLPPSGGIGFSLRVQSFSISVHAGVDGVRFRTGLSENEQATLLGMAR